MESADTIEVIRGDLVLAAAAGPTDDHHDERQPSRRLRTHLSSFDLQARPRIAQGRRRAHLRRQSPSAIRR